MVGGDVRGSWKSAPAQLFTGIFLDAISPEVSRHACMSQLMVNDELYPQPVGLLSMVKEKQSQKHTDYLHISPGLLDVGYKEIVVTLPWKIVMSTDDVGYSCSGSRRRRQILLRVKASHFWPSRGAGVTQKHGE